MLVHVSCTWAVVQLVGLTTFIIGLEISSLFFNDLVTKLYHTHEEEVGESSLLGMFEDPQDHISNGRIIMEQRWMNDTGEVVTQNKA
jgi:hypothetical protein